MLHELRVENLLLMERAELRFGPGLNVLTGETGAGKTLLAQALDLLLGGRAGSGIVRRGAPEAYVEGVFALPDELDGELAERIPDGAEELVLARRVWPDGRTRAYVCGRSASVADLQALGPRLLAFYGQHEHRKLMLSSAQLDVLDAHCGADHLKLRSRLAEAYRSARAAQRRVDELRERSGARERELDLAKFELEEIEAAAPSADEQQDLLSERERLRNVESLRAGAGAGIEAIAPEQGVGVAELLASAARPLESSAALDPRLSAISERLETLRFEAEELGSELRSYVLGMDADPGRLEEVEERLAVIGRLERKHGGSVEDVLAHAERCRGRLAELEGAEDALQAGEAELAQLVARRDELADRLSSTRRAAAPGLARDVLGRLRELAMEDAEFDVQVGPREEGCGPRGIDSVELVIAPNPGMPAGPLRAIGSGGELSRVMLALLSAAHAGGASAAQQPLLVFDEIDAGVGGRTARAVGEHLKVLAGDRQVLCITHLPQVAASADRHFTIVKDTRTVPALTRVRALEGDQVVGELVRMLGAGEDDRAASRHARELLRAA